MISHSIDIEADVNTIIPRHISGQILAISNLQHSWGLKTRQPNSQLQFE